MPATVLHCNQGRRLGLPMFERLPPCLVTARLLTFGRSILRPVLLSIPASGSLLVLMVQRVAISARRAAALMSSHGPIMRAGVPVTVPACAPMPRGLRNARPRWLHHLPA